MLTPFVDCRNPCFIRLCFAIYKSYTKSIEISSRNPCFIRLCFAIAIQMVSNNGKIDVAILVLLDYVLQCSDLDKLFKSYSSRNPCFIRLCFAIIFI